MDQEKIIADLRGITLLFDEPLSNYTFTKTGGPADLLAFPTEISQVQRIVSYCNEQQIPWMVLGNASNLIVRDGGIRGAVILLEKMNQVKTNKNKINAQAGAKLVDVSKVALAQKLSGLEFACGIPGSIGGAIFMNAGAYEGKISQVVTSVQALNQNGELKTFTKDELKFSYRHSVFQENKWIILSATFCLEPKEVALIEERMAELTYLRESKQPLEYPSCGSVFKRPVGHYTGKLIQDAGLQGLKWGGAQISEKHAGFIVNVDSATATDYVELIAHIQKIILDKYDVQLETEVRIIGEVL